MSGTATTPETKQNLTQIKVKEFGPVGVPANGAPFAVVKSLSNQVAPGTALALEVQKSAEGSVLFPDLLARQKLNEIWWDHRDALGSLYWNALDQIADPAMLKTTLQQGVADFATAMIAAFEEAIPTPAGTVTPAPADQAKALVEQAVAKVGAKMSKERKDALKVAYDAIALILAEVDPPASETTASGTETPAAKAEDGSVSGTEAPAATDASASASTEGTPVAKSAEALDIAKKLEETEAELAKLKETVKSLSKVAVPSQQGQGTEEKPVNKSDNPWKGWLKRP